MAHRGPTIAILAGGSGTRFWPAGRESLPKQFLPLDGDDPRPLLRLTVDRLRPLSKRPPLVIAPAALEDELRKLLPDLPPEAFVLEPRPRNTAAAVALAAHAAGSNDPLVIVPADHHVAPEGRYRTVLRSMAAEAGRFRGLVTLGLKPTRPATGYGYLRHGPATRSLRAGSFHPVIQYIEKPEAAQARRLCKDGWHVWSGGTFAFRPCEFLMACERHLPEVVRPLRQAFEQFGGPGFRTALARAYDAMPSISVDYGVMEKEKRQKVFVADIEWDDLGSWDAVGRHRAEDLAGNRVLGEATLVDSERCLVHVDGDEADGGHVALLGVRDLIVVRTKDAVLVARRGRGEDVRQVVERLRGAGRSELLE